MEEEEEEEKVYLQISSSQRLLIYFRWVVCVWLFYTKWLEKGRIFCLLNEQILPIFG